MKNQLELHQNTKMRWAMQMKNINHKPFAVSGSEFKVPVSVSF